MRNRIFYEIYKKSKIVCTFEKFDAKLWYYFWILSMPAIAEYYYKINNMKFKIFTPNSN